MSDTKTNSPGVIEYSPTDAGLAEMKTRLSVKLFDCKTVAGYEGARKGIAECRELRVSVEKKRVALKADALEFGRKVDAEAKRITSELLSIEEPLKAAKAAIDDEKERLKREAEEKRLAEIKAEQDRIAAEAEAKRQAEIAAENARIAAEREQLRFEREQQEAAAKAERERLDAIRRQQEEAARVDREKIEAERKAQEAAAKAERDRQEAEAKRIADERAALERERLAKETFERVERETRERIERERIEAERRAAEEKAAAEREAARIEAERPEREKLAFYLNSVDLAAESFPELSTGNLAEFRDEFRKSVQSALAKCRKAISR